MNSKLFLLLIVCIFGQVHAQTVVTTLPEFHWVVRKLAPAVQVNSLLSGAEDPHFVDASPGFIFKVAKADLVIFNGMELEQGWLPKVLTQSGNAKVQPKGKGHCDASSTVSKIGMNSKVDRSMGDVHAGGNPHYTLSVPRMIEVAEAIKNCLEQIGVDSEVLQKNYSALKIQMQQRFEQLKKSSKSKKFYVYHSEFDYVAQDFGHQFLQSLEKIPGVLPSATYLAQIAVQSKADKPVKVLASISASLKNLEKFTELSGIGFIRLRLHPKVDEDYLDFYQNLIQQIENE